jgi:L-ascorbate 6-phosphate lactonase
MDDTYYWPPAFLEEVENTPIDAGMRFWQLGGTSFLYRTPGAAIWIDPYFAGTPPEAGPGAYRCTPIPIRPEQIRLADVIISTHDHTDHCHEPTMMPMLRNTAAICLAPASSARKIRSWGVAPERVLQVAPGDVHQLGDVELRVYPGYDPGEPLGVTFVLSSGGTELFVSGDTHDGPGLAEIGQEHELDFALLAFGRTYYMDEEQVIAAARKLRPKTFLPFHWELWRHHRGDLTRFFDVYHRERPGFAVQFLQIGDSVTLARGGHRG